MRVLHSVTILEAIGLSQDAWLAFDDRVRARGSGDGWRELPEVAEVIDGAGLTVTPGFVDIHVHGGGGASVGDGVDSLKQAIAAHGAEGTTSLVASLVSAPLAALEQQLTTIAGAMASEPGLLGAHLEGPFLAPDRRGAHSPAHLLLPTPEAVDRLIAAGGPALQQVTLAPELPGAPDAIDRFVAAGVTVAVGHTTADYATTREAIARGARLLTHAFNAMPGLGHREPGPIGAALEDERVFVEIIADGIHVHPSLVKLLAAASPRLVAVSDATAAAAGPTGRFRLGDLEVEATADRVTLLDGVTLAGSRLTLLDALRNLTGWGVAPDAAVAAVTRNPAHALGVGGGVGSLAVGSPADLVVFTDQSLGTVDQVLRGGETL
jgi:N-acetylglucosamine-6-phosphate deacetylase